MGFFFRLAYPLLYAVLLIVYLPVHAWRILFHGKPPAPLIQRAGWLPGFLKNLPFREGPRIWIHAVSVGEVNVIKPVVARLQFPRESLYISTTTATGQQQARSLFSSRATIFYFPLDFRISCRRYLRAIRPDLIILTESEIWPGFIASASEIGIPLMLINGRVSDGSYRRYLRIRPLASHLFSLFNQLCMQSRLDRERIIDLGAPPTLVHETGNLKYDFQLAVSPEKSDLSRNLRNWLRSERSAIWLCGSTRESEEEMLLPLFLQLRTAGRDVHWVVAPRHPHRASEIQQMVEGAGLTCRLRSQLEDDFLESAPPDVLIIDTIGELAYLYSAADVVFIGGSLIPWGGHNVIEAAGFGRAIVVGPHTQNFREITESFLDSNALIQVNSTSELGEVLAELLADESKRQRLGRNARRVIRDNSGAIERTLKRILESLPPEGEAA